MSKRFLVCLAFAAALGACKSTTTHGNAGQALTLVKPVDQTIQRGETNKVSVYVRREKFDSPVELKVDDLPAGLEVVEKSLRVEAGNNLAEFTLYARPDADLVTGHAVRVTAMADGELSAVQWFHVAVKAN
jgi:uncharacterized protein YfaS (alpha-2-macroglobulin family)